MIEVQELMNIMVVAFDPVGRERTTEIFQEAMGRFEGQDTIQLRELLFAWNEVVIERERDDEMMCMILALIMVIGRARADVAGATDEVEVNLPPGWMN